MGIRIKIALSSLHSENKLKVFYFFLLFFIICTIKILFILRIPILSQCLNYQCQQFQINYRSISVSLSSSTYLKKKSCPISHATLWAWFKCYPTTCQPVYQTICILLFCQLYLVIVFQWQKYYYCYYYCY